MIRAQSSEGEPLKMTVTTVEADTGPPRQPLPGAEIAGFLSRLRQQTEPFALKRDGQPPTFAETHAHRIARMTYPTEYATLGLLEAVPAGQRAHLLFESLREIRDGLTPEERSRRERLTGGLLAIVAPDDAITAFLALRRVRANHKHVTRAIVTYLLNHPEAAELWARRRPAVTDCLEHALGKNVLRACVRYAPLGMEERTPTTEAYLRRNLLRHAVDPESARDLLGLLVLSGSDVAARVTLGASPYRMAHTARLARFAARPERPPTITWRDRGEIATALTALYREEAEAGLRERFASGLRNVAARCPRFPGRVALVLDASASLTGYGDRTYCLLAQSVAFRLVLERCVADLRVVPVGSASAVDAAGAMPLPGGATDLATGILDALETKPDTVLVVSDGYENRYAGDLARVLATLPRLGITTPIVFCHTQFTRQDDLTYRRPVPDLPETAFWHEADFPETLLSAFLPTAQGVEALRAFGESALTRLESEGQTWTR
jgi:hypothetical protein